MRIYCEYGRHNFSFAPTVTEKKAQLSMWDRDTIAIRSRGVERVVVDRPEAEADFTRRKVIDYRT